MRYVLRGCCGAEQELTDLFSNRELASAIWLSIFLVWAATNASIRKSFGQVLRALLKKHIMWVLAGMTLYVIAMILVLSSADLWSIKHLKITVYWFLSVAIVAVFRSAQETSNPNYFRQTLSDNINVVVLIEYVANLYSFNILVELAIFPVLIVIVMVQAFSEGKEEYKIIQTPLITILAIYLLSLLAHTVYRALNDPLAFTTTGALTEFLLPLGLSIAFLPFMLFLLAYLSYEQAFLRIRFSIPEKLLADAKRISFRKFRGDRVLLLRWAKIASYTNIGSRDELIESINEVKYMKWREVHPSIVAFERGWASGNAARFLSSVGVVAGDYNPSIDGVWRASSDYLPLRDDSPVLCNNIAYYICGDSTSARQFRLKLNVNEPDMADAAHEIFLEFCDELAAKALDRQLDPEIRNAILVGECRSAVVRERNVTVERHDWLGGIDNGYEVTFEICHPDFER